MDWTTIVPVLTEVGLKLLGGIVVLVVGLILVHWLKKLLMRSRLFTKMEPTIAGFLKNLVGVVLYALVLLSTAGILGVPLSLFVTILSLAGAALSLALQGALSNFIGGVIILVLKPFRVGQYIKVGDVEGTVKQIGMYYTVFSTFDGKEVSLPNSLLTNTSIVNFSAEEKRRIDLDFSLTYGTSIDEARRVLGAVIEKNEKILSDPAPQVLLQEMADSAVKYRTRVYVKNPDYWSVYYYLLEEGKRALDAAGLEIPFPQVDVHLKDVPAGNTNTEGTDAAI